MKISSRISIIFSFVSSSILVLFGVTIYLFESVHQERDFQERLRDRVDVTERFFLEKESFTPVEYEKIKNQFLNILPFETEEVIEINNDVFKNIKHHYSDNIKYKLVNNPAFSFQEENIQGESKIFKINEKEFLIIVTAVDIVGGQNLKFLIKTIVLLILIAIPILFVVSYLITKRTLSPISKKIQYANQIGASNLDQRLKVINPNDEIGQMAIAFNKLLDRLEVSFKAQKSFISNASHEIRTPLTTIIGEAEVSISKTRNSDEYVESLRVVLEEAEKLNSTVTNLLQLSQVTATEESVKYEKIDFIELLLSIKTNFSYSSSKNRLDIDITEGKYMMVGNYNLLKTAVINVLENACKYSTGKKVSVQLSSENGYLYLKVYDEGIGIPNEDLSKIFNPFYRSKNAISFDGSGIGLSLSLKIIRIHKGEIFIESEENKGTVVIISIPVVKF